MTATNTIAQPNWLDTLAYPFNSNYLELPDGKMNYVDEGTGEVILFIHGTPSWSFLYRNHIKELSKNYRCIALDHLGFGLSEKSKSFNGTPELHAANLKALIEHLDLKNITLVVHDFGGPIGLSNAIDNPKRTKRIVLFNTWLWETKSKPEAQKINKLLSSGLGRFLYLNLNFSPKVLLKKGFYDKEILTKSIHQQYLKPFGKKKDRYGLLYIGQALVGSSDWYAKQWEALDAIVNKPILILWGTKDEFIDTSYLKKWKNRLPNAQVVEYECGHFVQEEKAEESIEQIKQFMHTTR